MNDQQRLDYLEQMKEKLDRGLLLAFNELMELKERIVIYENRIAQTALEINEISKRTKGE
jgi:flagellar biosynthesis chaperone FliJ